jgi:predicted PurR-regulated permease PerM
MENKWVRRLIIINLTLLGCILLGQIRLLSILFNSATKAFLIPILLSSLIFYIIRPLNEVFINKRISEGKASLLTLVICTSILTGLISYFSKYAYAQFEQLTKQLQNIIDNKDTIDGYLAKINNFINLGEVYSLALTTVRNYMQHIGKGFIKVIDYFMNAFSMTFLIIVIVFYMLKDGRRFKDKVVSFAPKRYKSILNEILSESDTILKHYVTGQAKVALSLAVMIFIGYKIIGIPSALLLSIITFILAFMPFVGFFISMIIPAVIALSIGMSTFYKLVIVFIIVQTLKGRVVVPAIMAKTMRIHPLTVIFLVIGAIATVGPFAAFAVVPIYAIIKNVINQIKAHGFIIY